MRVLVTGSSGLIGSEAVEYFDGRGHSVVGLDNNMRRTMFGPDGDTSWNLERLRQCTKRFVHEDVDVRDSRAVNAIFARVQPEVVIHCAAQPSHDKAAEIPVIDFEVNAAGTMHLLEATRLHAADAVFIHMSSNKVYGDAPNEMPLVELPTRYDYGRPDDRHGIDESCRIDRTLHSLFGASKTAADVMAQEYGRYFGMRVGVFRAGCVTGPSQTGVQLQGFLSYLVRQAVAGRPYTVLGYKGKQVRDQIHSHDLVRLFERFIERPRPGEVYNVGGGRDNSASILECIDLIGEVGGYRVPWTYREAPRVGDHICYISDLRKLRAHFPDWSVTRPLRDITAEMIRAEEARQASRVSRRSR